MVSWRHMGASLQRYGVFARRLIFTLLTACVIVAIVVQDHTSFLPLGVFNTGAETLHEIADACLAMAVAVLVAQLIELVNGRLSGPCGLVRGAYMAVIILEVLLVFADQWFVTGNPAGRLGQYYEVPRSGNPPVILKKNDTGRGLERCLADSSSTPSASRVLFLGDSYTEGSGSAPECNYPNVVERVLREKWRPDAHVVNAGVSGYGPVEALSLLRWYRDQHCPVDAVVCNLTLQNDFADNPPRTERRVVAGIIFRFPRSWFLRTFHPLNTRTFRWALVLVFFGQASTHEMLNAVSVAGGPCDLSARPLTKVSPFLRVTVERDYDNARRVVACGGGYREATDAIAGMRSIAAQMKVPFFLVVFPDRILADTELQTLLGHPDLAASAKARAFATGLPADGVFDVYGVLAGLSGMYRPVDTHLSDLGNVVAGEYVGNALAGALSNTPGASQ
jgi:hypothetical protein